MHLEITKKGQKLLKLCESEGFDKVEQLLAASITDAVSPGICLTEGCDYTTEVEPDQDSGHCESCGGQTVTSALVLAGII